MSKTATALVFGLLGIVCGAAVSCRIFEQKYKKLADEEIASVKETFARRTGETSDTNEEASASESTTDVKVVKKVDYSGIKPDKQTAAIYDTVYSINEEQFGEFDDYEKISLTYFADGVLAGEDYEKITPSRLNVGSNKKLMSYFTGEDTDCVYVRNDDTCTDYEIVRDKRTYDEISLSRPYLRRE